MSVYANATELRTLAIGLSQRPLSACAICEGRCASGILIIEGCPKTERKEAVTALLAAAAEVEHLSGALTSIANNTCCDRCQEAALVAKAALSPNPEGEKE